MLHLPPKPTEDIPCIGNDDPDELEPDISPQAEQQQQPPKRKRPNAQWMETAASALNELAKGAKPPSIDEWDVFGKDVANSIRAISNAALQRRVKFAVQSAIFQTIEQEQLKNASPACVSAPFISFNTYQDNGNTYHTL